MRRGGVHLAAVGIGETQDVPGELDDHHLHSQTNAETRDVVRTRILRSQDLPGNPPLTESRTDYDSGHPGQQLCHVLLRDTLAAYKVDPHLHAIIDTGKGQAFPDALVSILQVVFAHEGHVHLTGGILLFLQEVVPGSHCGSLAHGNADFPEDGGVEPLPLHIHGHLVDAGQVLALHDALEIDIAERGHLHPQGVVEMALGTQHEDVRLNAHSLQLLDAVLRRLGLQFPGSLQVWHISQMYAYRVASQLPAQLPDGFHEGRALDVADGATHLRDHEVHILPFHILA